MLPDLTGDARWAVPFQTQSSFLASTVKEREEFMRKDLAKSGLTPQQVRAYVVDIMPLHPDAKGGYYIPYFDLNGNVLRQGGELSMYRIRQWGSKNRYIQPKSEELEARNIPPNPPYILPRVHELLPTSKILYICEGEKKAAATMNVLDVAAIGIGGCWNWGVKKKLHPWIKHLINHYGVDRVVVVPDGDIKRYDICTAYGTLADELRRLGVEVELVVLPDPEDKIDDLLVDWGVEAEGNFESLGKLPSSSLVVSQHALAEQYGLSTSGREARVVVNDTNVRKLLEEHPAFDEFWLNTDTNEYMMGDQVVNWDVTDYRLTVYMQHYFQLHNLNRPKVADAMREIADTNKRSPFKDWVDGEQWDGEPRLETWAIDLWGCEDSPVTREVSKKFLVGMYARLCSPGCKMDWMLVTVGAQGIGKSWWADLISKGQNVTFMASGNAKDDAAKMHRGLVICIDELDAFNKREMTYWKTMITTPVDTYRPPYGRGELTMGRRSVLYGTSNHATFLRHDSTGQRRFGVLEPTKMLDVPRLNGVLRQLWAEARTCYEAGTLDYYDLSQHVRDVVQDKYQAEDPLQQEVMSFLVEWQGDRFRMVDLLKYLNMGDSVRNAGLTGKLKDMLMAAGCEHRRSMRVGSNPPGSGYIINRELIPYAGQPQKY